MSAGTQPSIDLCPQHPKPLAVSGGRQPNRPQYVLVCLGRVHQEPSSYVGVEPPDDFLHEWFLIASLAHHSIDRSGGSHLEQD
jgi:hypothetical protein